MREQQREVRRLTEGWLVDVDVRKESLRGWGRRRGGGRRRRGLVSRQGRRCAAWRRLGLDERRPGPLCVTERKLRVAVDRRKWTVAGGLVGEELSGEKRRWRRLLVLLTKMGRAKGGMRLVRRERAESGECSMRSPGGPARRRVGRGGAPGRRIAGGQWTRRPCAEGEATAATIGREGAAE